MEIHVKVMGICEDLVNGPVRNLNLPKISEEIKNIPAIKSVEPEDFTIDDLEGNINSDGELLEIAMSFSMNEEKKLDKKALFLQLLEILDGNLFLSEDMDKVTISIERTY